MAGTKYKTTITRTGPFFTSDPRKTFRQNARKMLAALAAEGEADVAGQMAAGNAGRAEISRLGGHVSSHVVGRVKGLTGRPWALTAVVSVNNSGLSPKEGIALMAAASGVEGRTHAFRRTTGRIRRSRQINAAELLRGIA